MHIILEYAECGDV